MSPHGGHFHHHHGADQRGTWSCGVAKVTGNTRLPKNTLGLPKSTVGLPKNTVGLPMNTVGLPMNPVRLPMDT